MSASGWRPQRRAFSISIAALALSTALLAGCTSGDDGTLKELPPEPKTTTTSLPEVTTTIDPVAADKAELTKLAYDWYEVSNEISAKPNPADPRLPDFLTGELLRIWRETLSDRAEKGIASRPANPSLSRYEVLAINLGDGAASVVGCRINDNILFDVESDQVLNDEVVTLEGQMEAVLTDVGWKFSNESISRTKGVNGCATDW